MKALELNSPADTDCLAPACPQQAGPAETHAAAQIPLGRALLWGVVCLALLLTITVRLHLLNIPLERDEGEYAYAGQLMLQGIPPYQLAYSMKLPGTYCGYAAIIAVFGQSVPAIHFGLLIINMTAALLLFLLARRLFGAFPAALACAAYALLSLSGSVLGPMAHATHFVIVFALGGLLALPITAGRQPLWRYYASGLLLGMAFLMKQPGIFFFFFALTFTAWLEIRERPQNWRRAAGHCAALFLGLLVPFALTCLILFRAKAFPTFWLWTFDYARQYAGEVGFVQSLQNWLTTSQRILGESLPLCLLALFGAGALVYSKTTSSQSRAFTFGLLLFSWLAVSADGYFRPHYFVLLLPAVALFTGYACSRIREALAPKGSLAADAVPVTIFLLAAAGSVWSQRDVLFAATPVQASRAMYGPELFPETEIVAHYVQAHTRLHDTVAVIGAEPQIYFYANRHSATGYLYSYPWVERQPYALKMQQQAIQEIVAAHPECVIVMNKEVLTDPGPALVRRWFTEYAARELNLVGAVAARSPGKMDYVWGKKARTYRPPTPYCFWIYQRKETSQ